MGGDKRREQVGSAVNVLATYSDGLTLNSGGKGENSFVQFQQMRPRLEDPWVVLVSKVS